MSKTTANGRLCNKIIYNIAMSIIAKKHNLYVEYVNNEKMILLGFYINIKIKKIAKKNI